MLGGLRFVSLIEQDTRLTVRIGGEPLAAALEPATASGYVSLVAGPLFLEVYDADLLAEDASDDDARIGALTLRLEPGAFGSVVFSAADEGVGVLELYSQPAGAEGVLTQEPDREWTGTAPWALQVPPARYRLRVARQDHDSYELEVEITGGEAEVIDVELSEGDGQESSHRQRTRTLLFRTEVVTDDVVMPSAGDARLRVVNMHAPTEGLAVHVNPAPARRRVRELELTPIVDAEPLFAELAAFEASPYRALPAGLYDVRVQTADGPGVLAAKPDLNLTSGAVYSLFLFGTDEPRIMVVVDALVDTR